MEHWDASRKQGYLEGWDAARKKLAEMLNAGRHANRVVYRFLTHMENDLQPWAKSDTDQPPPDCDFALTDDATVRDVPSTGTNIKTIGKDQGKTQ